MKHIINRRGHKERFDERKVYASCYAACLAARCMPSEAEQICEKLAMHIKIWIKKRKEINSDQLFKEVIKHFRKLNKKAAYMYKTYRIID